MIHFAHANGFPSECYHTLFTHLRLKVSLRSIPIIGHNDAFPITENWPFLVDEIIDSIQKQSCEPVIGVGHSLGGVLTLLASYKKPALFKQVILLDAPLFGFSKSTVIKIIKSFGGMHLVTPSKKTKTRQEIWDSKAALKTYLLSRKIFENFNEQCLDDYISYGMHLSKEGQYHLRFNKDKESLIYKTVPHNMHRLAKKNHVPTSLIYSESSHIIKKIDLMTMKKKYHFKTITCPGSHLFPFEYPEQAAEKILEQTLTL